MKLFKLLFITFVLMYALSVNAHDFEVDGIYYELEVDGVSVTFAGSSYSEVENEYSGEVIIPATVYYYGKERKIKSINANAFRDCSNLTSIVIGDNITNIYSNAFKGCNNLQKVSLGKSVYSISDAFYYCNSITSVHYNCVYVYHCCINKSSVMEITFGDNVKAADDFTGTGWYSKQPEGLLYLDNWLIGYKGDEPTGDIIIADGTTHINEFALSNCKSITSVTIPKSVIYIGDLFLRNCDAIVGLNVDNGNIVYDSRENCNAIIETNSNTIIKACINTIIPQTVTQIGMCSFEELDFDEINIPGNVVEISEGAFSNCKKLRRVTIGNGVTSIGDHAFNGCSVLENLELGSKVEVIGEGAFQSCSNLENVKLPNSLLRIKQNAFYGTKWYNNQTESPYVLDGWILYDTGSPYLKEGIRGIADRVYSNNIGYSGTLKIPSTVVGIGEFAFSSCRGLYGVIIPNSVRHIASGAFYYTNISSVSLPQGIKCISSSTFQHCENLRKVVIPQSVTNIETGAFYFSNRIEDLYLLAKTPPLVSEEGLSVFDTGIYNEATLYVPIGSKELYQSSPVWKEFKQIVEIETEYNISYVIDGEVVASEILTLGEIITPPTDIPQKKGYKFSWENLPETMPAKDIIINGLYTPKTYYIRYEVDNKLYRSVGVNYGDSIKLIDEPTKKGHTFSGWSEIPSTMPAEDITVSGTFTANDYVITYIVDGEVYKTDSVTYGIEIVLIDEPVKEGHTFSGWGEKPSTMPAEDIVISGSFSVNSYNVIFLVDNALYTMQSVKYGEAIELPEPPQKEGFVFDGWDGLPESMPAKDIVLIAIFTDITGIDDVKSEIGKVKTVYDLNGRAVENTTTGIYIIDDKKVFVK